MDTPIRPQVPGDRDAIRQLHQAAFGTSVEADLVAALCDGGYVEVSLVAEFEDQVLGHILFSRLLIQTAQGPVNALSLAPLAVLPEYQRRGIGSALIGAGLDACRRAGHRIVTVLGHPAYYRRFEFSAALAQPLRSPFGGGAAWMALELVPGSLQGVQGDVEFAAPFAALGTDEPPEGHGPPESQA